MNQGERIRSQAVQGRRTAEPENALSESSWVARSSVSWGSIFAGAFAALLTYLILTSLGLAVAGGTLRGAIEADGGVAGLGIGTAIWIILATMISLFIGGYAGGRVSGLVSTRVGRVQGAVVASVFFLVLILQIGSAIGTIGAGIGTVIGAVGGAVPGVAQDEQVQQTVRQAMGDLDLRSPPDQVAQGIAVRLLRGDTEGARNYLAAEAGISQQEAQARIDQFRARAGSVLEETGATAARVAQIAGWTLFLTFLLGAAAALAGGHVGTQRNLVHPLEQMDERSIHERAA